jgi:hypothetical protein
MPDAPQIKVNGAGLRREAARLGQTIGDGVAAALAGRDRSLHIDTLRMQLLAGAGKAEIERAIRAAVERQPGVNRR